MQGLNAPIFHDFQGVAIEFGQNSTNETWLGFMAWLGRSVRLDPPFLIAKTFHPAPNDSHIDDWVGEAASASWRAGRIQKHGPQNLPE